MVRAASLEIGRVLYLFAPLLLSAASAAVVMRLDLFAWLKRPIDGGASFRGRRVFGDGKTWRGVALAVVGCVLGAAVQKYAIGERAGALALVDYSRLNFVPFGVAMGGGAMLGELPNSFVKRRLGIAPGGVPRGPLAVLFYVWDQVDLLTTSWPLLAIWMRPTVSLVATSVALALTIHPLVALVGYAVGARRTWR